MDLKLKKSVSDMEVLTDTTALSALKGGGCKCQGCSPMQCCKQGNSTNLEIDVDVTTR
ncbi:hypothetical protein [Riemerella anatipestifer]|uniref:Uncharacterized protein n=2 Tax=Riemerella anatipestifer TaxID=34085 RepID=A0AAP3F0E8_RIEAN|nr:hypothetical protein [Riemerella anatipestifer]MBT0551698.1 hypothetical protein [Riemerella anatipestifer]MBT0553164.1 hypothetical protein [Riemerella anatipestifer]MCE3023859.1 hypothetical protein [Riemerella anatipestifer]MCO7319840.1 hypothetical protein [Riemerella anatipestifer]MCQ4156260.1 hypothetical protein [Riemerella anatipestifer]